MCTIRTGTGPYSQLLARGKQKLRAAYTDDEIVLCTYIALYGKALMAEKRISTYSKRPESSIKMKIQNIAAMLDEKKIKRCNDISPLSGKTTGESGRETDWPLVRELINLEKKDLWQKCKKILS